MAEGSHDHLDFVPCRALLSAQVFISSHLPKRVLFDTGLAPLLSGSKRAGPEASVHVCGAASRHWAAAWSP